MQNRYAVHKVIDGEIVDTHECATWKAVEEMKDAISLVRGKPEVENINRD